MPISIHASAKEATFDDEELNNKFLISIHASAKEATNFSQWQYQKRLYFNPRLREGGDCHTFPTPPSRAISIHASAKEATATYCDTSAIMYISSLNNFFVHFF